MVNFIQKSKKHTFKTQLKYEFYSFLFNLKEITMSTTAQKTEISAAEFQKRVEIEASCLMYFNYMRKGEAFTKAEEYVRSKFVTV